MVSSAENPTTKSENQGIHFDGVNTYISITDPRKMEWNRFTFESWIKIDRKASNSLGNGEQNIFSTNQKYYNLRVCGPLDDTPGVLKFGEEFDIRQAPNWRVGKTVVDDGQWHHIALTYRYGEAKIYVDGQLDLLSQDQHYLNEPQGNPQYLIGSGSASEDPYAEVTPTQFVKGNLKEVCIWRKIRTAEEIQADMNRQCTENDFLISSLALDRITTEGNTQKVLDIGRLQNHGIIHGATIVDLQPVTQTPNTANTQNQVISTEPQTQVIPTEPQNQVMQFDGANDYIEIPQIVPPSQGTIEAWIYADYSAQPNGYRTIVEFGNDGLYFGLKDGKLLIYGGVTASSQIQLRQWVHVAAVWSGSGSQVYVNGIQVGAGNGITPSGSGMGIGYHRGDNHFKGKIIEVRLWNRVRTADQIKICMKQTLTGQESGLVGYWPLDQQSVLDQSSNSNNGTVHGATIVSDSQLPLIIPGFSRSFLVQKILDTYVAAEQTERWKQAIKTLNQQQPQDQKLDSNWVPVIQNVESTGDQYRVQFINKYDPDDIRWIQTSDSTFEHFKTFFNNQAENLGEMFQVDSVTGTVTSKTAASSVSAGVGLGANKADLVKVVINWAAQGELYEKSDNPDLDTAVGVQSYLNLTQYSHGVVTEIAQVISDIRPALKNGGAVAGEVAESLVSTVIKTAATEGLGIVLNIANVVMDSIVLSKTESTSERASATTTLVFDVTATASSVLALGLGLAGASVASAILGAIAVPIAGLAAGIPTLVELYSQRNESAKKVAEPFGTIANGYAANADGLRGMTYQAANQYTGTQSSLKPKGGAVISEIDLVKGQLKFGSQYLYQVHPERNGVLHTKTNDADFFLSFTVGWVSINGSRKNEEPLLSIREGLDCPETIQLQDKNIDVVVLPRDIEIVFDYTHDKVAIGWQNREYSPGINALRQLEDYFYEKFYYDYHSADSFAISEFRPTYKPTTTTVKLDEARRTVVIPQVADIEKNHLTYRLEGDGGTYIVILSEQNIDIRIKASDKKQEKWVFNIDRIGFRKKSTDLRPSGCWNLVINDDGFTIGQNRAKRISHTAAEPQTVKFEGKIPERVTFCDNLGHIFMVNLKLKKMSLLLDITRKENYDINMDMNSSSLLYRAHASYQYLKSPMSINGVVGPGLGILESESLSFINADNIGIVYEDSITKRHFMGAWDPKHFALVAHCYDDKNNSTSMQVDRQDSNSGYSNLRDGTRPKKLGFTGKFEDIYTQNNEIFFTQKMPQQGSEEPTVLQYCMYSGSGYYYIDAIDANPVLMDEILKVNLSELTTSKVDELLRQTNPNWTPHFQADDPNRSYAYAKDRYTIIGENSQGIGYQLKVYKETEATLSWKMEEGIVCQILPGSTLQLTGTQGSNAVTLPYSSAYPSNYPNLAKGVKKAILLGKEGTDQYIVDRAILEYEAVFIVNYASDLSQDTLRLSDMSKGDFSYLQQGHDLVLTHKPSHHLINIIGVFDTDEANHYQHLQLQFQDGSFAVTEVANNLSAGSSDDLYLFLDLEDLDFQQQGDNLVVSRLDKTDGVAYSNFYTTYNSLNALQVNFPSETGTIFSLNAEQLATLGSTKVSGQELVNSGSTQQFFSPTNTSYEIPKGSKVSKREQNLVVGDQIYQRFFGQPAAKKLVKIPLNLENAIIVRKDNSLMFVEIRYQGTEINGYGYQVALRSYKNTFCEFSDYYMSDNKFGGNIGVKMPLENGGAVILNNAALTLLGSKTLEALQEFKSSTNGGPISPYTYDDIGNDTFFLLRLDRSNQEVVAYKLGTMEIARVSANILPS